MAEDSEKELHIVFTDIIIMVLVAAFALGIFSKYFNPIAETYYEFLNWVYSYNWEQINLTLAVIFSFINIGLVIFMIQVIRAYYRKCDEEVSLKEKPAPAQVSPKEEVKANWTHIQELANSSSPSDWNMAVLRADALMDHILQHLGYEGETMADRLKIVDPSQLKSIERLWSAHRLRNTIAHEPLEQHPKETVARALESYMQALKELGFME